MGFNFIFRSLEDRSELKDLIDFISAQDLSYPDYHSWVERTEHELDAGYKKAVMAISGRQLIGNAIYQENKRNNSFLELKNLRVHPSLRNRLFAAFMLRQVEADNSDKYSGVILDARSDQQEIIKFLVRQGYTEIANVPLYDPNSPDVTMIKPLSGSMDGLIAPARKLIVPR